jgi:SAM-dependent methyltransferase
MAEANADEVAAWRGDLGRTWSREGARIDALQAEVTAELVRRAGIAAGHCVLDIGCGAGASTRAAADAAAPGGRVVGVDAAAHMVAAAEARGGPGVSYIVEDAQDHPFPARSFDRVISQFGVMFFSDTVAAFANLRRATRPGGRCVLAAWAAPEENPWFHLPRAAAVAELGDAPGDPDAPGPTRFRDGPAAASLLRQAGWDEATSEAVGLCLRPEGSLADIATLATRLGPAARLLRLKQADDAARARVAARIEAALAPFSGAGGTRIPAVINFLSGRAP